MRYWTCQLNVAHTFTTYLGPGDFNAAPVANYALISNLLVFAAVALPILGRTEYSLAEQTVLLWSIRPVVDRFGFFDLAERPTTNVVGRCQRNMNPCIIVDSIVNVIQHCGESPYTSSPWANFKTLATFRSTGRINRHASFPVGYSDKDLVFHCKERQRKQGYPLPTCSCP